MPFERLSRPVQNEAAVRKAEVRDLEGCIRLLGPIELCWSLSLIPPHASVSLKIFGQTVVTGEISESSPCIQLQAKLVIAEANVSVCLDIPGKRITAKGEACLSGDCVKFEVTLIQW